jgi:hypothetical protein
LQEPVDALEQIFSGHGAAPENLPVVSLDRVEIENLGKKFETKIEVFLKSQIGIKVSDLSIWCKYVFVCLFVCEAPR